MSKVEQKIIDYMVVCINEFADKISVDYKQAFNYLRLIKINNKSMYSFLITSLIFKTLIWF